MKQTNLPPELTNSGNIFIKFKYKYHIHCTNCRPQLPTNNLPKSIPNKLFLAVLKYIQSSTHTQSITSEGPWRCLNVWNVIPDTCSINHTLLTKWKKYLYCLPEILWLISKGYDPTSITYKVTPQDQNLKFDIRCKIT